MGGFIAVGVSLLGGLEAASAFKEVDVIVDGGGSTDSSLLPSNERVKSAFEIFVSDEDGAVEEETITLDGLCTEEITSDDDDDPMVVCCTIPEEDSLDGAICFFTPLDDTEINDD